MTWKQVQPAPETMSSLYGAATVHGNSAYFSRGHNVYAFQIPQSRWKRIVEFPNTNFSLEVIENKLTAIGGCTRSFQSTNVLLSMIGTLFVSRYNQILPPMPTSRISPAAAATPSHLVVAGGRKSRELFGNELSTVEVLDIKTLQWSTASSLPQAVRYPQMTLCSGALYLSNTNAMFSCSVDALIDSCYLSPTNSEVWSTQANIPIQRGASLVTLRGHVLAVGGADDFEIPTGAIHRYNAGTDQWSVVGWVPTPRYEVLVTVLPDSVLLVVGGSRKTTLSSCPITEAGISSS